ncbi:MAG: FAD-dependent oxidoreductase [Veillonellaceae bacterium]|nr:FAD-dependent oxidoreductase [Veillonellaceae bacterium]
MFDILIIGGGPAGMNAALYGARKELSVGVIAANRGGQITSTQEVENYLGYTDMDSFGLLQKFSEHIDKYPIEWITADISSLRREADGTFTAVTDSGEEQRGRTVILASGKRSRTLNIPGEEMLSGRGVSYCATCDGPFYRNRRVVVVGAGDSAVEAAIDLSKLATEVHMLVRSRIRASEVLVTKMRETTEVKEWHHYIPLEILGEKKVSGIRVKNTDTGEEEIIETDGVFVEIGGEPNTGFVPAELERNENNEIIVARDTSTNIPGFFASGDVTDYPDRQIIIAAADGAKAALAAHAYLLRQ